MLLESTIELDYYLYQLYTDFHFNHGKNHFDKINNSTLIHLFHLLVQLIMFLLNFQFYTLIFDYFLESDAYKVFDELITNPIVLTNPPTVIPLEFQPPAIPVPFQFKSTFFLLFYFRGGNKLVVDVTVVVVIDVDVVVVVVIDDDVKAKIQTRIIIVIHKMNVVNATMSRTFRRLNFRCLKRKKDNQIIK